MKRWFVGLLFLAGPVAFGQFSPPAQAQQQAAPQIPFDSVPNFFHLPPDMAFGEAASVAVNSKGHVFVMSRGNTTGPAFAAAAAQLLEFDSNGQFLREIGKNLYAWSYGHAVRIDRDDNIWAVDKGSDLVIKFNPEGRVEMVFGRKPEASEDLGGLEVPHKRLFSPPPVHEDGRFRQPTDVAWDAAGNIYISDGYINSRVAKYDKTGQWIKSWGERGSAPGQFHTPHGIGVDPQGNVYVADRGNRRIQVFDGDGRFLRQITIDIPYDTNAKPAIGNKPDLTGKGPDPLDYGKVHYPGGTWTICITPGPNPVLYTNESYPGRIFKLSLDGKVLGVIGGRSGKLLGEFGWVHGMACPSENELYVAEILNWRVQKLVLHPEQARASASAAR